MQAVKQINLWQKGLSVIMQHQRQWRHGLKGRRHEPQSCNFPIDRCTVTIDDTGLKTSILLPNFPNMGDFQPQNLVFLDDNVPTRKI